LTTCVCARDSSIRKPWAVAAAAMALVKTLLALSTCTLLVPLARGAPDATFLLSSAEMEASRFGMPREDLAHVSTNNNITYLPNGDKFMGRLYDVLTSTQAGDFVYASFWAVTPQEILKPVGGDDEAANRTNRERMLVNVLAAAVARNVTVRLLVSSGSPQDYMGMPKQCELIRKHCGPETCVMDDRHGHSRLGSSHEKIWMVRLGQRLIAFSGSMDIFASRWDTAEHDINSSRWKKQPQDPIFRHPWHGTMYEIEGTAAEDIYMTFLGRWNDPKAPKSGALTPLGLWVPSQQANFAGYSGSLPVQVVRTFGCRGAREQRIYQNFAPYGEYSYAALWFKALRRAQKYVFVADQFMFFAEAMEAVVAAAEHVDFVIIFTNNQKHSLSLPLGIHASPSVLADAFQYWQHRAVIDALEKRDPSGKLAQKVHMFNLYKEGLKDDKVSNQIYDHEKTLLIDDELALVGSTGVEEVGFTNDAELSVAIESAEYVPGLRRQMFAEYLQLTPDDARLDTPQSTHQELLRQADDNTRRVRHFSPVKSRSIAEMALAEAIYAYAEPDGRCTGSALKHQWQAVRAAGTDRVQEELDAMRSPRIFV